MGVAGKRIIQLTLSVSLLLLLLTDQCVISTSTSVSTSSYTFKLDTCLVNNQKECSFFDAANWVSSAIPSCKSTLDNIVIDRSTTYINGNGSDYITISMNRSDYVSGTCLMGDLMVVGSVELVVNGFTNLTVSNQTVLDDTAKLTLLNGTSLVTGILSVQDNNSMVTFADTISVSGHCINYGDIKRYDGLGQNPTILDITDTMYLYGGSLEFDSFTGSDIQILKDGSKINLLNINNNISLIVNSGGDSNNNNGGSIIESPIPISLEQLIMNQTSTLESGSIDTDSVLISNQSTLICNGYLMSFREVTVSNYSTLNITERIDTPFGTITLTNNSNLYIGNSQQNNFNNNQDDNNNIYSNSNSNNNNNNTDDTWSFTNQLNITESTLQLYTKLQVDRDLNSESSLIFISVNKYIMVHDDMNISSTTIVVQSPITSRQSVDQYYAIYSTEGVITFTNTMFVIQLSPEEIQWVQQKLGDSDSKTVSIPIVVSTGGINIDDNTVVQVTESVPFQSTYYISQEVLEPSDTLSYLVIEFSPIVTSHEGLPIQYKIIIVVGAVIVGISILALIFTLKRYYRRKRIRSLYRQIQTQL